MPKHQNLGIATPIVISLIALFIATAFFTYQRLAFNNQGQPETQTPPTQAEEKSLVVTTDKTEYEFNDQIVVNIKNETDEPIWYSMDACSCKGWPGFTLESYGDEEWDRAPTQNFQTCHTGPCNGNLKLEAGGNITGQIGYPVAPGYYRLMMTIVNCSSADCSLDADNEQSIYSNEFRVQPQSAAIKELTGTIIEGSILGSHPLEFKTTDNILYDITGNREIIKHLEDYKNIRVTIKGYLFNMALFEGMYTSDNKTIFATEIKTVCDDQCVADGGGIKVISPSEGENLQIGKPYVIKWTNYSGDGQLTIDLKVATPDNKNYSKTIAIVPAIDKSYKWIVSSEGPENKYQIEVYPSNNRPLFGVSEKFNITGEQVILLTSPKPYYSVDATQPLVVTGKARKVFNEGTFTVSSCYYLNDKCQYITGNNVTSYDSTGNNYDWLSGNYLDFITTLNLASAPACYIEIGFYVHDEKGEGDWWGGQPFYVLPLSLYGNNGCQQY